MPNDAVNSENYDPEDRILGATDASQFRDKDLALLSSIEKLMSEECSPNLIAFE